MSGLDSWVWKRLPKEPSNNQFMLLLEVQRNPKWVYQDLKFHSVQNIQHHLLEYNKQHVLLFHIQLILILMLLLMKWLSLHIQRRILFY